MASTEELQLGVAMARRAAELCELVAAAALPMDDRRRGWTYLPGERPGAALADLDRAGAKAAMRLLATGLRPHAFAQAATVMALEDVLDEQEHARVDRHRGDYWVAVYGVPGEAPWGWRLEGHHLSVNWTLAEDGALRATPQFLGANPARTFHGEASVLAPLEREEALAIALVQCLDGDQRGRALLPGGTPGDILTGDAASIDGQLKPAGVALSELGGRAADLGRALLATYLGRLPAGLPPQAGLGVRFAWAGGTELGEPRYYRLQGERLVIELDNTQNRANHIHTVVRDPGGDFGDDLLRSHRAREH